MIYPTSPMAVAIFLFFVGAVLGLSFFLGRKAKSAAGYYAAHGQVNWFVNGIAFAGDYLSAASFLGICGMIAFYGFDGFLYSIGYLAGWIVALFVIAEPIKRLGKFTFADALDAKFDSPGIKLAVAASTLIVSAFYLIPQMVGAGALIKPLLGLEHWQGVLVVGVTVTLIVTTAGMVSTTWVQFIKGSLLVAFCGVLVVMILGRGLRTTPAATVGPATMPTAIGLGAGEKLDFSQGPIRTTDRKLDVAIDGQGFFMIMLPREQGGRGYTRRGKFEVNKDGFLAVGTAEGPVVIPPIIIPADMVDIRIGTTGEVQAARAGRVGFEPVGTFELATFPSLQALRAVGNDVFVATDASGDAVIGMPTTNYSGRLLQGTLEDVDHPALPRPMKAGAQAPGFVQGALMKTGDLLDLAIEGPGFFAVELPEALGGGKGYTRAGGMFCNSAGQIVVGRFDGPLLVPAMCLPPGTTRVRIQSTGEVFVSMVGNPDPDVTVGVIPLSAFKNPAGLRQVAPNLFVATEASGPAAMSHPGSANVGVIRQGVLESAGVEAVAAGGFLATSQEALAASGAVRVGLPAGWGRYERYAMAGGREVTFRVEKSASGEVLTEAQVLSTVGGQKRVNGRALSGENQLKPVGTVVALPGGVESTGPLGPLAFLRTLNDSTVLTWGKETVKDEAGVHEVYFQVPRKGADLLTPGGYFKGLKSDQLSERLNFLSLMIALFCGTASLPHILIRYYTVKDQAAARKSTVVGIAAIGAFYVLTLYLGLGAMTSGALDPTSTNMAAPLLAKSFNDTLFAVISAIAFTTVLGTVSGLIMAGSGAVAHDLLARCFRVEMNDAQKVRYGKIAAAGLGVGAMVLGILFEKMNVTFLVGWAFNIAASANLPALIMLLFWKRTTAKGIAASVTVGLLSSLTWILLSGETYRDVYGIDAARSVIPFSQPALVTIPLAFATLVVVSLMSRGSKAVADAK